jgi:uncharacterized membrane protein YqgA involved in biofilm formation
MWVVLWGSIVNAIAIVSGSLLGRTLRFPERIRQTIMQALGLAVVLIGLSMGLESNNILIPIVSLVVGSIIGEGANVELRMAGLGDSLQRRMRQVQAGAGSTTFTEGFMTATLVYCVGAMAVVGSLNSGLTGEHQVLYAKSMLDGVSAVFFAASLGIGVGFSAISVLVYQGGIALLATYLAPFLSDPVIAELTSTGGILIFGIGLNMLGLTKLRVGNMLPAMIIALLLTISLGG